MFSKFEIQSYEVTFAQSGLVGFDSKYFRFIIGPAFFL